MFIRLISTLQEPDKHKVKIHTYYFHVGSHVSCLQVVELAKYYTRDQLKLAKCVVLCNITPVSIFGQRSWGWILAAETPDKDLELLSPPPETDMTEQV